MIEVFGLLAAVYVLGTAVWMALGALLCVFGNGSK